MRVPKFFLKNDPFLTMALILSFLGPFVRAIIDLPGKPIEFLLIGLLMAPIGFMTIGHWLQAEERRSAVRRLRQAPTFQVIAFFYLGTLWLSALRTGLMPKLRDLLAITLTLIFTHILFPILALHRERLVLIMKAIVATGMAAMAFSWLMLFAKWVFGWNAGVMLLKSLLLEKKMLTERLGFPYLLKGPFLHPNALGLLAVATVPCVLYFVKTAQTRRTHRFFEAGLILCALTLGASLSILSAIPVILAVVGFMFGKRKRFHQAVCLGASGMILFFFFVILSGANVGFLKSLPIPGETRVILWNQATALIQKTHGGGIAPDQAVAGLSYGLTSHNTFYETALLHGIPAFIALTIYLLASVFILRPRSEDPLGLSIFYLFICWLIMLCVEILFLGHFKILSYHVLVLAIPFSLLNKSRNRIPSGPSFYSEFASTKSSTK
ncbi:MAG: hypothetical protein NTW38_05535 [Candidatus Aminicenantes bacterium]|nr:hypothetical protein [Candidatus Aminicenantes bacterium]